MSQTLRHAAGITLTLSVGNATYSTYYHALRRTGLDAERCVELANRMMKHPSPCCAVRCGVQEDGTIDVFSVAPVLLDGNGCIGAETMLPATPGREGEA